MTLWYILFPPFISGVIRLSLEKRRLLIWALAENALLISSTKYADLSWTTILFVVATLVTFAFWQTQIEYYDSGQDANSHKAPLGCPAKFLGKACPTHSARHHTTYPKGHTPPEPHILETNHGVETEKTLHGRLTMFPCDLQHWRRSGFKDKYHHSYLFVGYPGAGILVNMKKTWFSVRPEDHAFNGGADLSMSQKLNEFLSTTDARPNEWAYAYLLTPPSVTWQLNNPLSFWYLYNKERELTAMIVQLQTSYGERRLWLTRNLKTNTLATNPYAFKGTFEKDLQISPFTFTKASYVIESSDPCAASLDRLQITVTLKHKDEVIMHGIVNSTDQPLDVATAGLRCSIVFLLNWWWVPLCVVVSCRIYYKAAKIYLTHNEKELNIQTRAEPGTTAIAKSARISERTLEKYFYTILSHVVSSQSRIKSVTYITSGEHCARTRVIRADHNDSGQNDPRSPEKEPNEESCQHIHFQVNTPTFYTRFFHYKSPFAAIESELLDNEPTRTVWASHPEEFVALFPRDTTDILHTRFDWRWRIISFLRSAPIKTNYLRCKPYESFKGISTTDYLVMQQSSDSQLRDYRRALMRAFLGHWMGGFSIGSIRNGDFELIGLSRDAILRIYEGALKIGLVILAIFLVRRTTLEPRSIANLLVAMLSMSSLNLWACMKSMI